MPSPSQQQRDVRDLRKDLKALQKQMAAMMKLHEQLGNTVVHELRCIREAVAPIQSGESTTTETREKNTPHSEDDVSSVD